MSAFFDINAVERELPPKAANLKPMIRTVLLAENGGEDTCWDEMEKYTVGKYVTGSKQFDQHQAVLILLEHDEKHGGHIVAFLKENKTASHKYVWTQMVQVLGAWLVIHRGVVTGLRIEHKNTDDLS
jgi:hypothetical protein